MNKHQKYLREQNKLRTAAAKPIARVEQQAPPKAEKAEATTAASGKAKAGATQAGKDKESN